MDLGEGLRRDFTTPGGWFNLVGVRNGRMFEEIGCGWELVFALCSGQVMVLLSWYRFYFMAATHVINLQLMPLL